MKKTLSFSFLFVLLVSFTVLTKHEILEKIHNKLDLYFTENFPEKIYIHTDKPYYSLDESIWFTGYMVNGITHTKSSKSAVFYVELINEKDSIVSKKKFYSTHISSAGDFKIDKDWQEGKYLIRAYTNDMRNRGDVDFFQKEISIWATRKTDSIQNTVANTNEATQNISASEQDNFKLIRPDLHFYPEGGVLVAGLKNKVALKIKNKAFHNVVLKGGLYESNGTEIFNFKTLPYGLGMVSFIPESNKNYYATLDVNGSEERYDLPKVISSGYTLQATNNGKDILINVSSNTESGVKGTFLVGHQRGKLFFEKIQKSNKPSYSIKIPTNELQDGIAHITLFNSDGNPVCERLVFIDNPTNNLSIAIHKPAKKTTNRQKVDIALEVTNSAGERAPSYLSMAVRDMTAVPYNTRSANIKSWLLLNSDLRGNIADPGYFFEKEDSAQRRYLLDLIMLTHGWRKFTWTTILNDSIQPKEFNVEKGIHVRGRTKNLKKPYEFKTAATRISFLGANIHQETQQADSLGNFEYGPFIFFDSIPVLIEARTTNFQSTRSRDRNLLIMVKPPAASPIVVRPEPIQSSVDEEKYVEGFLKINRYIDQINLEYNEKRRMLDEVIVKAKKEEELSQREEAMLEITGYPEPSARIIMDDITGAASFDVYDLIRRINGVLVYGNEVWIRGSAATIYLDGMEIEPEFLDGMPGSEISFIDALKGVEASVFPNSGNGVIAIYSNTGSLGTSSRHIKRKPGIIDFKGHGFYTAREFFAPDHINGFEELMKADIRTTLHWEPQIRSTVEAPSEVSFFTSDTKGDFIIEVEGISDDGIPVHGWTTFTVE